MNSVYLGLVIKSRGHFRLRRRGGLPGSVVDARPAMRGLEWFKTFLL
jgi:hypothetical protein